MKRGLPIVGVFLGGCFVVTSFDGYEEGGAALCAADCGLLDALPPDQGAPEEGAEASPADASDAAEPDAPPDAPIADVVSPPDVPVPPPPSCANVPDGYYCAGDLVKNGQAETLYQCLAQQIVAGHACAHGCATAAPPYADTCKSAAGEPASCSGIPNGWYCGSDRVHGDPNGLFHCMSGYVDREAFCATCVTKPAGTNDVCQ